MKWLWRYLIYALAAYALYRLWPARGFVWWALLASAILMAWTAATVKTAISDLASTDPFIAANPSFAAYKSPDGSTNVARFWTAVNIALTSATLVLSIWALVLSD